MLLSRTAVYALRAMAALARLDPGECIRSAELAVRTEIPPAYVSKVMRRLTAAGLVEGVRGHGGGFALARPPRRIRVSDVLEAMDAGLEAGTCAFGWGACDPERPCPLHDSWSELNGSVTRWAEGTTLEGFRRSGMLPGEVATDPDRAG